MWPSITSSVTLQSTSECFSTKARRGCSEVVVADRRQTGPVGADRSPHVIDYEGLGCHVSPLWAVAVRAWRSRSVSSSSGVGSGVSSTRAKRTPQGPNCQAAMVSGLGWR